MTILGKKLPLIVISDDEDYDECKSGCSDNECDSDMCNINWSLGHVKCFKHMKEQRGVVCDTKTPCHRCRTRLSVDTNGAFRKHFLHCEKQRQQKSVQRDKSTGRHGRNSRSIFYISFLCRFSDDQYNYPHTGGDKNDQWYCRECEKKRARPTKQFLFLKLKRFWKTCKFSVALTGRQDHKYFHGR